jgi:hypothetical protein
MYGFAYDPYSSGGPFLWIFDQVDGYQQWINQVDLATGQLTGVTHNVENDLGNAGIAGGLFLTTDFVSGKITIGGLSQASPDAIICYELGDVSTNQPPVIPGAPSGPDSGVTNVEYTFTATTTDPEGDPIEYWFEWGDGANSGWVSPGTAQHAWAAAGTYDVKVKARDNQGGVSDLSVAHPIVIAAAPVLAIQNVTGGFGKIKATIVNTGGVAANNVNWTISLSKGILGKETKGNILSLAPGANRAIKSKFILGFGKTVVTITATCPDATATVSVNATLLLFFIKLA